MPSGSARRVVRRVARAFAALAPSLLLGACGDGDTDAGDDPFDAIPVVQITSVGSEGGGTIGFDSRQACSAVGETFELAVSAPADAPGEASRDVSASVSLTPAYSDALEVLSQGDGGISLRMTERDIVQVRVELDDGEASGKTLFFAGFTPDTPDSVLMYKDVPGGCLVAVRLPEVGFCSATFARKRFDGGEPESFTLGSLGRLVRFEGCEYELPDGVSFLELTDDGAP